MKKTKEVKRQENCITISITTKTVTVSKAGTEDTRAKRRNPIQKYGCAGISKLHGHYHEDETPPDEMVCERGK